MIRTHIWRLVALVTCVCCYALPASSASAAHVQCGDVITQDTTLDSDLACAADGLTVAAPDVTVDLAHHTIEGPGSAGRGVIAWAGDRVQIRNGTIRGFAAGVDTDGARGTAVRDMVLEQNGAGLHCAYAPECRIEDSTVRHNGVGIAVGSADGGSLQPTIVRRNRIRENGLGLAVTGERAIVTDNRIEGNRTDGIRNDYGYPVDILRNVISRNGAEGVQIEYIAEATVAQNRIAANGGNGVAVFGSGGQFGDTVADVHGNRILGNGRDGVLVQGQGVVAAIERNRADRNGDDGIETDADPASEQCCFDVVVGGNKAFFNADLGIEAGAETTDGGGNRARHNGNPAQCVGVSCS
ncbi:MAG: right-handed parallel beta-helix repeat-containing protein [Solirubrobacterales bacterium]